MPKILPGPPHVLEALYLIPLVIFAIVVFVKLRTVPKEQRAIWVSYLSLAMSLTVFTMMLTRFQ